jgi:3-oxoacyl-[acyl-carrier protein] reductase
MHQRRWGRIITLTSSGVEAPLPRLAISNALRQSLLGWSKTLAAEVAADNITANIIVQGRIHTDRVDELDAANAKRMGKSVEDVRAQSMATIPAGRYGRPEELADVVAFLASERASYITGSIIRVDGGLIRSI